MTTKMNLNGTTRKALVAAIAEITGEKAIYRAMPTCNYDIGDITVTKDGCIIFPDDSDILTALAAARHIPPMQFRGNLRERGRRSSAARHTEI